MRESNAKTPRTFQVEQGGFSNQRLIDFVRDGKGVVGAFRMLPKTRDVPKRKRVNF